jgi:ketosteroid isomerase-like protein
VVLNEIHDADAHTSIIHASSTAETKIGPYANEYTLMLTFTEDGKKVTKFDEFVDSAYSEKFFAALENKKAT